MFFAFYRSVRAAISLSADCLYELNQYISSNYTRVVLFLILVYDLNMIDKLFGISRIIPMHEKHNQVYTSACY